jgi:hypothetical protein
MRKTEQRFWDRMRRAIGTRVRLERIENVVGVGTPDVVACCYITSFVELKAVEGPPVRATTRVLGDRGLSRDQRNWHKDWHQWGGKSFILVGVGRQIFMIQGQFADALNDMTMDDLTAHNIAADWLTVAKRLGGNVE